jgi:hypothetical protein
MFTARLSGFVLSETFASLQNCKISLHCDLSQIIRLHCGSLRLKHNEEGRVTFAIVME